MCVCVLGGGGGGGGIYEINQQWRLGTHKFQRQVVCVPLAFG